MQERLPLGVCLRLHIQLLYLKIERWLFLVLRAQVVVQIDCYLVSGLAEAGRVGISLLFGRLHVPGFLLDYDAPAIQNAVNLLKLIEREVL